jgi:hypothetical protein
MDVNYWNNVIYKEADGTQAQGNEITVDELWDKFQIKSWPKFKDGCVYNLPSKWSDDIRVMLTKVMAELGSRIGFMQIKEKWCKLTVYYKAADDAAKNRMQELIAECIEQLQIKKVYPITLEDYARLIDNNKEKENG